MDNKVIKTMAVAGLSATILAGCGIDGFDPSKEMQVDVYGPAPYEEYIEEPEELEDDLFDPSKELDIEVYGPSPIEIN